MHSVFSGETDRNLLTALRFYFPLLSRAFIVNWIPEQGEDIYFMLVDEGHVAVIEVPRQEPMLENSILEVLNLSEYRQRKLSAEVRRKLEVALILMSEKVASSTK